MSQLANQIDRVEAARAMMAFCEEVYTYVVGTVTDIKTEVAKSQMTVQELTDIAHAINKASKFCEESRKFINNAHEIIASVVCFSWTNMPEHINAGKCPTIRGKYALGIPDVKMNVRMPNLKRDPDKFIEFMAALGVDKEAAVSGNIKAHWPAVCEYVQRRFEEGLPDLPHMGPDDKWPVYKLTTRELHPRKGEVELTEEQEEN